MAPPERTHAGTRVRPGWLSADAVWAVVGALVLHGLGLQALQPDPPQGAAAPASTAVVRVREVTLPASPAPASARATVGPAQAPAPRAIAGPQSSRAGPAPESNPVLAPAAPRQAAAAQATGSAEDPAEAAEDRPPAAELLREVLARPVPRYAAQLPASFHRRYALRRGAHVGEGELRFDHDAASGRYELKLLLQGPHRPMWEQSSLGWADAHGLQPEQFNDRRRGRRIGLATFDRPAAEVRFAGRAPALPMADAAQDRLSWLVQLPAALAADGALQRAGATVWLQVFSARGDVQLWAFAVRGTETLAGADGQPVPALHLQRLPERPYDTQVDVWLDPQQGFLPQRLWLTHWPAGDRLELDLRGT